MSIKNSLNFNKNKFSNKFYNTLQQKFKLKGNNNDIIEHFSSGGCFEFAYNYQKFVNPKSKIKMIFGIDNENGELFFDLGHAFIETPNKNFIDINGRIGEKEVNKWLKKMKGNEYDNIKILEYGEKFQGYIINEDFINNLEPYGSAYFHFSSNKNNEDSWKQIFEENKKELI